MNNIKFATAIFIALLMAGCATPTKPTLTPLEIQSLQTREYESSVDIVFPSVISVLQDLGYIIRTAGKDTGLITADSPIKGDTSFIPFVGTIENAEQTAITAFLEQIGNTARVRLNIVAQNSRSTIYGQTRKNDTQILDAKVYQNAFEKIENAIFVRSE